MWKYALLILILTSASSLRAQKPVIDSMIVNEDSSQLSIYGSFGNTPGEITVNGDTLKILQWNDTMLIASIPDTGIGSAGPMVVQTQFGISDTNMLSVIVGTYSSGEEYSDIGVYTSTINTLYFTIRFDLHRILGNQGSSLTLINFEPIRSKTAFRHRYENDIYSGNQSQDTLNSLIQELGDSGHSNFDCTFFIERGKERKWYVSADLGGSSTIYGGFTLDSLFRITPSGVPLPAPPGIFDEPGYSEDTIITGSVLFRPVALIALQNAPTLIAPILDSNNWEPHLLWLNMLDIDFFNVEISTDSTFSINLHEFPTSDTSLVPTILTPGLRYFWRVQGKNSEGYSKWSSVWSFGENPSSVKFAGSKGGMELHVTESSIQFETEDAANLTIYNVLGEIVARFRCDGEGALHSISLSSLELRGSNYFVILHGAGNSLSDRFSLLQ